MGDDVLAAYIFCHYNWGYNLPADLAHDHNHIHNHD